MSLRGHNLHLVKSRNLSVILRSIKKATQISRTELADATGLSHPAVGNLVSELLEMGLIKAVGNVTSKVGRNRVLLALNDDSAFAIGVDLSRNGVRGVLANLQGEICATVAEEFGFGAMSTEVFSCLHRVIVDLRNMATESRHRLLGIGIGTPGPVDVGRGRVFEPPNFPGFQHINLKELVEKQYRMPCFINDDARTSALGEAWFGVGQSVTNQLFVSLCEGVGSGVIIDGHVYSGAHDIAGQIGHYTVEVRGELCECGNIGCLETVASIPAIAKRSRKKVGLLGLDENGSDTAAVVHVINQSRHGVPPARQITDETLDYICGALVSAINSYDPEIVILGGRLIRLWPESVDILRTRVLKRCYYHIAGNLRIERSILDSRASPLGAITLLLDRLFADPATTLRLIDKNSDAGRTSDNDF